MEKRELFIKADVFYVKIITECNGLEEYIENNLDDFNRLTIHFEVLHPIEQVDTVLKYYDEEIYSFQYSNDEFILKCPWNKINDSTILPMIFRYIVELFRQNRDEIKVHASSILKNDKTSLLFAPSEGGKTTTAMAMCQKYGCLLKSNDATVVKFHDEIPYMERGDSVFKVRGNSLKTYSQEIYENKIKNKSNTPWFDKARIMPEDLGVKTDENATIIKNLFFIKLDTLVDGCTIKKYDKNDIAKKDDWFKSKMQVFQNIGGTIRGADLIPVGNNGEILPFILPSLDNQELALKRINFINKLFDTCEVYQLRGQLEEMTKIINDII